MVIWTIRWHPELMEQTWPGVFGMPMAGDNSTEFLDILIPCAKVYGIWLVVYLIWIIFSGRFHGEKLTGKPTLFDWNMTACPPLARLVGFDKENPTALLPVLKHSMVHGGVAFAAVCSSYLFFYSFWAHTAYIAFLFTWSVYLGSLRYYKMMTRFYESKLEKLIESERDRVSKSE